MVKRDEALNAAVEAHGSKLLAMIGRRLHDQVEAEDVLQDVFAEFLQSYDLAQAIESLGGWLYTIAQNKILDRFRRRKTQRVHQNKLASVESEKAPVRPDDEWARSWLRTEISDALDLLPEEQREIFVLNELEGKSFEEIAVETGVSINTLLSRKRYAVLFLRKHLQEVYDELK